METQGLLWCKITGFGNNTLFGHTSDHVLVAISRRYEGGGIPGAEKGDIVEFIPRPYGKGDKTRDPKRQQEIKWFAEKPRVIAKKFALTGTDWKAQQACNDEVTFAAAFAGAQTR
jgi:hypothetical protein